MDRKQKRRKDNLAGYLFISPWIIGFVVFTLIPCIYSMYISLTDWDMFSKPRFVGFKNYAGLFKDDLFYQSLYVTIRFVLVSVGISILLSFILALLVNSNSRIMYLFRTIFYIPSVVSGIAVSLVWLWILSPDFGVVNYILSLFGIKGPDWFGNPATAPWAFVMIMCTTFVGAPMVIFVAGLQNVPQNLYESASLDGAGYFAKLFYITLPEIKPIFLFNLITMVIGAFKTFVQAYTIAGMDGSPQHSMLFYVMYLYKTGFDDMKMGKASAMAWIFFLIVLVFTIIIMKLTGVKKEDQDA